MKLELYEARGNLDKIDYSLLSVNDRIKKMTDVSPNSVVTVDKLRDKEGAHTWANVVDNILTQNDVAFVVLRSNKRQIALMTRDSNITGSSDRFLMIWSNFAYQIPKIKDLAGGDRYITTESSYNIQTKMWKTVEAYIEHIQGRKNWDIIVVHKDDTLGALKDDRKESRKGMEIKPQHADVRYKNSNGRSGERIYKNREEYKRYINGLHQSLNDRLVKYVEAKLVNVTNVEELKTLLNSSNIVPKKIKLAGQVFNYNSMDSLGQVDHKVTFSITYEMENTPRKLSDMEYFKMIFRLDGFNKCELADTYFKKSSYTDNNQISFVNGIEYIIKYNRENNE